MKVRFPLIAPRTVLIAGGLSLLVAVTFLITDPGNIASRIRELWFDRALMLNPRRPSADQPIVVEIGRDSLSQFGGWPWPRSRMAQLMNKIAEGKPRVVALDILLPPREPAEEDEQLGFVLSRIPTVLGAVLDPEARERGSLVTSIAAMGNVRLPEIMVMSGAVLPAPQLLSKSKGLGVLSLPAPEGQPVRAVPLLAAADTIVLPGLSLETARVGLGGGTLIASAPPQVLRVNRLTVPLPPDALMRLYFTSANNRKMRTIPAEALLNDQVDVATLKGKWVFLGASAPEAGGLRLTAIDPFMPSVQIHAEALDQILTGRIPIRRSWMKWVEAATTLAIGTLTIFAVVMLSPGLATAVVFALGLMLLGIGLGLSTKFLWLIDPIAPLAAVLFAAQSTALAQFGIVYRQRIAIERRFAQHLSPQVVQRIVDNPGELKLQGETRTITAVFTDIEGFTALTERLGPEAIVALLDRYIDTVADIIVAHGGMVDKIVGDAVHAYFNAPLDLPDHAVKAVECALQIVADTEKLRREPDIQPTQLGRTRIGIETGPAVLGDVGRGTKRDYTAYGRPPNLASRLQEINKKFGSSIALGPGTVTALSGKVPLRHLGRVKILGIDEEIEIFEPTLTIGPVN